MGARDYGLNPLRGHRLYWEAGVPSASLWAGSSASLRTTSLFEKLGGQERPPHTCFVLLSVCRRLALIYWPNQITDYVAGDDHFYPAI